MFNTLKNASVARKTGGFTLVELLVVIVVIGVLAAIAVPIFLSQADKANTASAESDAANIAKLIQADYAETGTVSAMNGSTYTSANGFGSVTAAGTVTLSGDATTWCVESTVDGQVASFSAENGAGTGCAPAVPWPTDLSGYTALDYLGSFTESAVHDAGYNDIAYNESTLKYFYTDYCAHVGGYFTGGAPTGDGGVTAQYSDGITYTIYNIDGGGVDQGGTQGTLGC